MAPELNTVNGQRRRSLIDDGDGGGGGRFGWHRSRPIGPIIAFSEPVASLVIFPFISKFIEDLGITDRPERIGYYAGIIESLFALTMFTTVLTWGRLSDRIGRKPVMLIGLSGATLSVVLFGIQKSFLGLVLCRMIGGALNGNVAVIKSIVAELTDASNQARAFSYLPLAWSMGSILAPIIGGSLSEPARHYPNTFGRSAFFHENPYFLPCFVAAMFPFCGGLPPLLAPKHQARIRLTFSTFLTPLAGFLIGFFFLEETLPSRTATLSRAPLPAIAAIRGSTKYATRVSSTIPIPPHLRSGYDTPGSASIQSNDEVEPPSISSLFMNRRVQNCLVCYALLALQTIALDALFVLFAYSPIKVGGLAFDESEIGKALGLGGVFTVLFQLVLFPSLQKRFGTVRLYRVFMGLYPFVFGLFPVMATAARKKQDGQGIGVWPSLALFLLLKSMSVHEPVPSFYSSPRRYKLIASTMACLFSANCSYGCNMLVITSSAPSRRLLGTLNGLAQMLSSLMRAIGPLVASSLFVISKEKHVLGGQLVWLVWGCVAVLGFVSTLRLKEEKAAWRVLEEGR
ncbi:BQ2448_3723 [Microbotryum intermedium]|uniref:BQ2448_3723 protein n=1 Tax=Microbotryum intermedium TaxID=269621 RepID=A0A238FFR0_9BASI|nr:BQ2448_3723 [Microbotryum intermedium]